MIRLKKDFTPPKLLSENDIETLLTSLVNTSEHLKVFSKYVPVEFLKVIYNLTEEEEKQLLSDLNFSIVQIPVINTNLVEKYLKEKTHE